MALPRQLLRPSLSARLTAMPDDLKELQKAVKQVQEGQHRPRRLDWLVLLGQLTRLATVLGVLVLLGVAASAIWPHADKIRATAEGLLHPKPAPPASQPAPGRATGTNASMPARSHQPLIGGVPSSAPEQPVEPTRYRIGDIFAVGSWEYSVTGSGWQDLFKPAVDKTVWPEPGRKFLVLRLTACNMGEETALLPPPRLIGPDGAKVDPTTKIGHNPTSADDPLSPDRHYKRQVVFDVPAGKPYRLLLQGGWLSDRQAVVEIGP